MTGTSKPNSVLPFVEEAIVKKYIKNFKNSSSGQDNYVKFILDLEKIIRNKDERVFAIAQAYLASAEGDISCLEPGYITVVMLDYNGKLPIITGKIYEEAYQKFATFQNFQSNLNSVHESLQKNNPFLAMLYNNIEYHAKRCALHIYGALEMQALANYKKISKVSTGQKVLADEAEYFQGDLALNAEIAFLIGNSHLAARIRDAQKK